MGFKLTISGGPPPSDSGSTEGGADSGDVGLNADRDATRQVYGRSSGGRSAFRLKLRTNKRAGHVTPRVRSRRKSRSFKVR